jgi:hypothetical protein
MEDMPPDSLIPAQIEPKAAQTQAGHKIAAAHSLQRLEV